MYPLIEIQTIPIVIKMEITNAKLEYSRSTAELEISRDEGGLSIKSRPISVNLDTFEARSSMFPTLPAATEQNAKKGLQAAYKATADYAQQGQLLLKTKIGQELVTQFAAQAQTKDLKTNVGIRFLPDKDLDIGWTGGELSIQYEMDKLNFDWKFNQGDFDFTPGDINITVTQQPDVLIKYVGGAIYIPPSSDPNYEAEHRYIDLLA